MRRTQIIFAALVALLVGTTAQAQTCNRTALVNLSASIAATEIIPVPTGTQSRVIVCGFTLTAGDGISSVTGTNAAASAELSDSVPTNARWHLLAMTFSLVTSATV